MDRTRWFSTASPPAILYTFITNGGGVIISFYVSENSGDNWTEIEIDLPGLPTKGDLNAYLRLQGNYNLSLGVDPADPYIVYLGAVPLLKAIRNPTSKKWRFMDIGKNIHSDNHAFAFHPTDTKTIFTGNDGGIYKSNNGGATWDDTINEGLCIMQFEFIDSTSRVGCSSACGNSR